MGALCVEQAGSEGLNVEVGLYGCVPACLRLIEGRGRRGGGGGGGRTDSLLLVAKVVVYYGCERRALGEIV